MLLTIRDDGAGFDPATAAARASRLGMTTMRERIVAAGGSLELESAPNFIIIDDVTLVEGQGGEALTINLSTYFRLRANGV